MGKFYGWFRKVIYTSSLLNVWLIVWCSGNKNLLGGMRAGFLDGNLAGNQGIIGDATERSVWSGCMLIVKPLQMKTSFIVSGLNCRTHNICVCLSLPAPQGVSENGVSKWWTEKCTISEMLFFTEFSKSKSRPDVLSSSAARKSWKVQPLLSCAFSVFPPEETEECAMQRVPRGAKWIGTGWRPYRLAGGMETST